MLNIKIILQDGHIHMRPLEGIHEAEHRLAQTEC
jgi:hypothetical protein